MDERQKQLVAAGEAMRKWIHVQRGMWTPGFPQSLPQLQPQFAGAPAAGAIGVPAPVPNDAPLAPAEAWPVAESGPSWSDGISDRVGSTVGGTTALLRSWWKVLAAVAAVVLLGAVIRFFGPSMTSKVSRSGEPAREAASTHANTEPSTQSKPSLPRVNNAKPPTAPVAGVVATAGGGRLQVESSPAGLHVSIDGNERGMTPLTVESLSAGSHKVVVRGDDGSVQRTVAIKPGETTRVNESIYSGWLHVAAPFEVQLSEGNTSITLDDSNQVLLPPGPHDVRFESRTLGLRQVHHIDIRPGETTAISLETPVSHITVTASEPASVSIDGQAAGQTPLTDFAVPVGTRDVTVTSASGVVRRHTITVKVQPTTIDVDFSKP